MVVLLFPEKEEGEEGGGGRREREGGDIDSLLIKSLGGESANFSGGAAVCIRVVDDGNDTVRCFTLLIERLILLFFLLRVRFPK